MEKKKNLLTLFISTLYLSTFTFGGGYVIVSLMKSKFVDELGWLNKEEMLDMAAIAQSAPGAIAVNAALVIGYKVFGIVGALVAMIGTILPPLVIISIISVFYNWFKSNLIFALMLKGMQAGVSALLIKVIIDMTKEVLKEDKVFSIVIIGCALIAAIIFKVNIMYIILSLIGLGLIFTLIGRSSDAS
ncbi:MAG: chromate transporter [Peptoniphilaceae bacterium]|nr:chromate transporter [Peptoniphilaceae bacterium]MDY6019449.1 chromate transporter [Anaerococcus sp.]